MNQDVPMSSPVAFVCMLLLAMLCAGCSDKPQAPPEARLVDVVRVTIGSTNNDFAYSGEVRPRYETNLSFRLAGKIVARNVEVGGLVKKGDVLARLDPEDQQLNARSAQSQLAAAKSEYEQSKAELERYTDLYKKDFISKVGVRPAARTHTTWPRPGWSRPRRNSPSPRIRPAIPTLAADHAGVVTAILIEVGQVVAAGQTVMKLARTDEREVVINIPENRLTELSDAEGNRHLAVDGSVEDLQGQGARGQPVRRSGDAHVCRQDQRARRRSGDEARHDRQRLAAGAVSATDAVTLPATALFQDNGHAAVWVVDKASEPGEAGAGRASASMWKTGWRCCPA